MQKKTILFLEFCRIGGPPNRLIDILQYIKKYESHNYDCVVAGPPNSLLKRAVQKIGFSYHSLPIIEETALSYNSLKKIRSFLSSLINLLSLAVRYRASTIYANHYSWGDYANLVGFILNKAVIIHLRDVWPVESKTARMLLKFNHRTHYLAISKYVKKVFADEYKFNRHQIFTIYDAIDGHVFYPLQPGAVVQKQLSTEKTITMMSRVEKSRNIEIFIDAAAILRKKHHNLRFIHYGYNSRSGDKSYLTMLKKQVSILGLSDSFNFHLYLANFTGVAQTLRASYLTIVPAGRFALPNTMIESIFCGTPVIAYNTGGNPEIIINNKTGILLEINSPIAYANAIENCLTDNHLYTTLSSEGLKKVNQKFSHKRILSRILSIIDNSI